MIDIFDAARDFRDVSTTDLLTQFINRMKKRDWMLMTWAKSDDHK